MAENTVKNIRFKMRTKTAAEWAANDEVLLAKEVGYVSDNGYSYKVGDGSTKFSQLPFAIANSAYKLNTPVTITIGNITKSFDGSASITWSMEEITSIVAAANSTISQAGLSENVDDTNVLAAVKTKLGIA